MDDDPMDRRWDRLLAYLGLIEDAAPMFEDASSVPRACTPWSLRVPVARTTDEEIIKLATQKKHLTNVIKLVAYQAESEMVRLLFPHYRRAQLEGRALVHSALASAADIKVTDSELLITLAPLSSAHRSRAVATLCASLNATATIFPGTRLRLRYVVAGQT
jgi:hypothetical protein